MRVTFCDGQPDPGVARVDIMARTLCLIDRALVAATDGRDPSCRWTILYRLANRKDGDLIVYNVSGL